MRTVLAAVLITTWLLGCAAAPQQKAPAQGLAALSGSSACTFQGATFWSQAPLLAKGGAFVLGHAASGKNAPKFDGELRVQGEAAVLDMILEGDGLRMPAAADATSQPLFRLGTPTKLGDLGDMASDALVRVVGGEGGKVRVTPEDLAEGFQSKTPVTSLVACDALSKERTAKKVVDFESEDLFELGFAGHLPGRWLPANRDVPLRETRAGAVRGHFPASKNKRWARRLEEDRGWERILVPSRGVYWVGWIDSTLLEPGSTPPDRIPSSEVTSPPAENKTPVRRCDFRLELEARSQDLKAPAGTLEANTPFLLGGQPVEGKVRVDLLQNWLVQDKQVTFWTPEIAVGCALYEAP